MAVMWTPSLAVGISAIDEQHQALFRAINELIEAMEGGQGKARVAEVIAFLERYVAAHFGGEERLMLELGYAGYEAHRRQHDDLIRDFHALKDELAATGPTTALVLAVNARLAGWLRSHIAEVDRPLALAVAARRGMAR